MFYLYVAFGSVQGFSQYRGYAYAVSSTDISNELDLLKKWRQIEQWEVFEVSGDPFNGYKVNASTYRSLVDIIKVTYGVY